MMQKDASIQLRVLKLAAILIVLVAAVSAVLQIERILLRWQVIFFLAVFIGLQMSLPLVNDRLVDQRKASLFIALQGLIVAVLVLQTGIGFSFYILFFILSVNAAIHYPLRWTLLWIASFILVTAFLNVRGGGWERLLLDTAVYGAGYLFFGITTNALRSAQLAQTQNERLYRQQTYLVAQQKQLLEQQTALLGELQDKNKQLQEYAQQVETLVVVEERNRLSREMHDTLGHRLTSLVVQLEAAQRLLPEQSERAARMLGEVRQEIRQALAELRQTVGRLRDPVETELDLPHALRRLAEKFQVASGLQIHLELPQDPCLLEPAQRLALYRAVQEGLTNIQRHAQAGEARLRVTCTHDEIRMELQDNGQGLHPVGAEASPPGFGLRGLSERAASLGGEVRLENAPGGGAVLTLRLPRRLE